MAEQIELGRNLGAADDGRERALRMVEHLLEGFQLGLQAAPGVSGQHMAEAFGRGMGAVRGGEGIVDPEVAELGERGDESGIVLLLAGMEARVLQTDDVAGMHGGDRALGDRTDAIVDEGNRPLDDARDFRRDRLERGLGVAAFGPAEMREQDDLAAFGRDFGDGLRGALDARGVGDHAVFHRHVQVDAHQHAFALHVDVVEGAELVHSGIPGPGCAGALRLAPVYNNLPIATAVSAMRLEKPHSLSYHAITRTSVPFITLVWSMWKVAECGSWLKSIETLWCSV